MSATDTAVTLPPALLALVEPYLPPAARPVVERAFRLAAQAHAGYRRKDGSPYLQHVTAVAGQLARWQAPAPVLAAGLLHDILKETYAHPLSLAEIEADLGAEVVQLVQDVARLGRLGAPYSPDYADSAQERMENVTAQLPWVALILQRSPLAVVIKIADKLDNFRSLAVLTPERQAAFATGVMSVFVPFAERLGMRRAKHILEDHAFAVLQPDLFATLAVRYPEAARTTAVAPILAHIRAALAARGLEAELFSRHRSLFDLHRLETAVGQPIPLHLADPLIIVTPDEKACYQALGVVHALWPPQPGKFVDAIAIPKANGYRALHTQVHYREGEWLMLAIRDQEMNLVADHGITAVWQGIPVQLRSTFPAWQEPQPGKIGVLTPDGDFVTLPQDATPVDFAYAIHIGLGHQCTGALVNGLQTPLDRPLENGDVVRILSSNANVGPSQEWLTFVKTGRARAAIRRWLKAEKPGDAAESGWRLLDEQLRLVGLTLSSPQTMRRLTAVADKLGHASRDALLLALGLGQIDPAKVAQAVQEADKTGDGRPPLRATLVSLADADMPQRLAACCRPAPPDAIVGYVTKANVVTIHRADCFRVRSLRPLIQADWSHIDMQPKAEIQMLAIDRPGLVRDVSAIIAETRLNMTSFYADRIADGSAHIQIGLGELPRWQLDRLIEQLRAVPDVRQVERQAPSMAAHMSRGSVLARHFENPYTLRPVTGASFYGRRRELRELINNLRDVRPGEAVLLWGPRRIGKTSLLLEFQQRVMASEDYVLVFIDMQRLSGRSVTMFIRDILRAIADALGDRVNAPRLSRLKRDPLGYFRSFLENVPELQNKHLVLIIDEFQLLSHLQEEAVSLADLNRAFRSLIQHRGGLSIIFSGGGVLDTLLAQPDASFMLEVARFQKVDCLDEPAARQLITEPAQRVAYESDVVERLLTLTARHPYYLQWLCGELVARADRTQAAAIDDALLDELLAGWLPGQGEQFFNHLWGSSTGFSYERQYMSKLALVLMAGLAAPARVAALEQALAVAEPVDLWPILHDLTQMDTLIQPEPELYAIRMPLFQHWLQANYTVERVLKERRRE